MVLLTSRGNYGNLILNTHGVVLFSTELARVGRLLINFQNQMEKKLYVGNLPYSTTDASLKDLFAAAGNVAAASIIIDKFSKRSKGFGFVEMATEEEAAKAKEMFNGSEVEGRKMIVDEARPMKENNFRGE